MIAARQFSIIVFVLSPITEVKIIQIIANNTASAVTLELVNLYAVPSIERDSYSTRCFITQPQTGLDLPNKSFELTK